MTYRLSDLEELLDDIKYDIESRQLFYDVRDKKYTTTFEWCEDKLQMFILWRTAPWLKKNNDFPDILQEYVDVILNLNPEKADDVRVVAKFESLKEGVRDAFRNEEKDLNRAISIINANVPSCDESDNEFDDEEECNDQIDKYNDDAVDACAEYLENCVKLTSEFFSDLHKLYLKATKTAEKPKATTTDAFQKSMKTTEKKKTQPEKKKAQPKSDKDKAKAKAAAEKAKAKAEKEKAKALKQKAKDKAAAEKEKAKAEKQKAKDKAAADKEKAKADKQKAKEKAAAEKAKAKAKAVAEKAKKKAAVDKAKAKEKKAKDKCADARGKALEALAKATAMKASKISKKFETCEAKINK